MNLEKTLFQPLKKAAAILTLGSVLFGCQPHVSSKPDNSEDNLGIVNPSPPTLPQNPPLGTIPIDNYDYTTITRKITSKNIEPLIGGSIEVTNPNSYLQGINLIIPSEALFSNTEISIGEVDNPPELPYGLNYVGFVINLEPDGINFNKDIEIKIPYTDESLNDAGISNDSNLQLYAYNKSSGVWEQINIESLDTTGNILTAKINHFSYYAITGLSSLPPSDLGTPLPGDLLYTQGVIGGDARFNYSWMPGHVGIYVGEKKYSEGLASKEVKYFEKYNVVEALFNGVQFSYYNIPNVTETFESSLKSFSGNNLFMGTREPKSGSLTLQQREIIVDYVETQIEKKYALEQTIGSAFGMLPGNLVKGPDKFNCVGLAEKAYELAGVNGGIGLISEKDEENLLTPAEHYNSTKPASGKIGGTTSSYIMTIRLSPDGKDTYINKNNSETNYGNSEYLEVGKGLETLIFVPANSVPINAKVVYAKLNLYSREALSIGNGEIKIYRISSPWEESKVNWKTKPTYGSLISNTNLLKEGGWYEWDITSFVQEWIMGEPNYGFTIFSDSSFTNGGIENISFFSGDSLDKLKRPKIIIGCR